MDSDKHTHKIVKTIVFFATWINMGLVNCVISATLPDWLMRLHINFEIYGRMVMVATIFATCVVVTGGIMRDRFEDYTLLIMALLQTAMGTTNIAIPFSSNEYVATVLLTLKTMSFNMTNIVGSTFIIILWKESASLPVHFLHMGYSIGCTIAPLISEPYLSETKNTNQSQTDMNSKSMPSVNNSRSLIEVPYAIGGITT